ncbi:MAG: quinone oxidoreductase [Rhodospirillaceae bacterium]|nr:quinone oxidoreductase [Rhodospirillaceae bacterium]|tara:strand:+ start:3339 stop:4310 length:972 start_codon:yes stop_codon:yes gene_type:complete
MAIAIRIHEAGGPEVLRVEDVAVGSPGAGEIRIRHTAVGLNFIDTYQRSGLYPMALPATLGMEAAAVIEALGDGVSGLAVGDRIAYPMTGGAYCTERVIPADKVVKVPDTVDDNAAAAMMLKGMTVEYLLHRTFPVEAGQTILFHAAAGGVGLIACQWAKALGVTVIGTVSTDEKAALAKAHGCDHTIVSSREDIAERVKEITDGKGVPVVYDSIGADTFETSLASLSTRGMMVSFGQSSGPITSFNPAVLAAGGSLYYTRPGLANYIATRDELELSGTRLFDMVGSGKVRIEVNQTYPLVETEQAHRDLEGRKTTGSTVLLP